MATYAVHRLSLKKDDATEVDFFGFGYFSTLFPSSFNQFLSQLSVAPFINSIIPASAVGHDHSNEVNVKLDLGDLGLYGIPFPRVTRSTSDPLKTTFPFTP